MSIQTFFKSLASHSSHRRPSRRTTPALRRRLETLEERCLLSLNPAVSYLVGTSPQAILTADLNSDTRLDIAVANQNSANVSVLLGNADGTFQPAQDSSVGAGPHSLELGHFNADGNLDLVTANAGDVSVLLGDGTGAFQAPNNITIGSVPASVAVGDFNSDGKLDLAVTSNLLVDDGCGYYGCYSHYEGRASVLLGNGVGSFSAPITSTLGYGQPSSIAVGHFDADTNLDVAIGSADSSTVAVLLGTGTGTFGVPTYFSTGSLTRSVTAGDVNSDGKLDLVTANQYSGTVSVLLGTGTGSFMSAQNFAAGSALSSVAEADFNGDSNADLVMADAGSGTVHVLLGTGTGSFTLPLDAASGTGAAAVAVGDFNDDHRLDLVSANSGSNNVSLLLNDGIWPALDAPSITVGDVTVTEGNTGTVNAAFTVSLSAAYNQVVTVHYATEDGSATLDNEDYRLASDTLIFAPGETSQTILVLVNGDRLLDSNEFFQVRLSNPINGFLADAMGVATILDDEPRISITDATLVEGNTGTTTAVFTVSLATPYDEPVRVNFSTVEGDTEAWFGYDYYGNYYPPPTAATADIDFLPQTASVTFGAGETAQEIRVVINGDRLPEASEYVSVELSDASSGAMFSDHHGVGAIIDDEPFVSINSANGVEGNAGTNGIAFVITLSPASDAPVTVDFSTADGSATAATGDYQAATGSVTFAPGVTSQAVAVLVNGDRLGEYDESFYVNLTGASAAHIASGTGYGTILDNEPRININSVSVKEKHRGTRRMTFTVTLSAAYDEPVTVNFATEDGSATVATNDYVAKSGNLIFGAGERTKTITVMIKGDKKKEFTEYFSVLLSGAGSNSIVEYGYGGGTIRNDDGRRH